MDNIEFLCKKLNTFAKCATLTETEINEIDRCYDFLSDEIVDSGKRVGVILRLRRNDDHLPKMWTACSRKN